uniref:HAT C-terminal dimerisation domain-containing protein n=1 Tax=Stegastes partitus TaxID=144197 RepID=A0A3B5B1D1_9TELE
MHGGHSGSTQATAASLRVSWILAKKKRPFTDSETVKDFKMSVTSAIKQVLLSDTSNIDRVDILATDVFETLVKELRKADHMAAAVDESTDRPDTAQLCMYVRFFDGTVFKEELLGLLPLDGHTTGEILFENISSVFEDNDLDMKHVCMLVRDGAPSMARKVSGLAACWSAVAPQMTTLHCVVHQTVLCPKLSDHLKSAMDNVMAIINVICSASSLQHRLFRQLLSEMSAEHQDLLLHNDVRWLSKGTALERFCDLREEITTFLCSSKLKRAETYLAQILDDNLLPDVCFLYDLFRHLNDLNVGLQGGDKTVIDLVEQMGAFQVKLDIFTTDLSTGRILHFPPLRKCISFPLRITDMMTGFIMKDNFTSRLDRLVLLTDVMSFDLSTRAKEVVPSIDEGKFILSQVMAHELHSNGPERFWCNVNVHQFPNIKKVAVHLLSMFGSTFTCESSFSHMNMIKKIFKKTALVEPTLHGENMQTPCRKIPVPPPGCEPATFLLRGNSATNRYQLY